VSVTGLRPVLLAALLAGLWAGRPLAAQDSAVAVQARPVSGRVTDGSGGPVAAAEVLDAATGRLLAVTDSDGVFRVASAPARLRIRRLGFAPREVPVGAEGSVTVALRPLPIALEAVVVTAARREQKLKDAVPETQLLTREQIEQTGASNLGDAVTQSAGMQLEGGVPSGAGVYLQGLGSQRVLVLMDGQPVVGRLNGNLDLSRLPSSLIERVEVVRGPQSTLYGSDAMGGVINVITRRPAERGIETNATLIGGSQGRLEGSATLLGRSGAVGFVLDGGARTIALAPGVSGEDATYARRWNAAPKVHWQTSPGVSLEASALVVGEQQRFHAGQLFYFADNTQGEGRLGLEWRQGVRRLAPTLSYSVFNHLSRASTNPTPASDSGATDNQQVLQAEVTYSGPMPGGLLDLGVVARHEAIRADRVQGEARAMNGIETYAQGTWIRGPLSVSPGVRLSAHQQWGTALTPRVAALWRLTPAVALRGSVGTGFRAPDFKELYYNFVNAAAGYAVMGNPDLKPEHSTNVTVGAEVVGSRLYGRASVYVNHFHNFIDYTAPSPAGVYTFGNIARGLTQGVETQLGWQAMHTRLEVEYAYLDARDQTTGLPLLGRASHTGRLLGTLMVRGSSLGASLRLTGRTPISTLQDSTGTHVVYREPFARVDLHASAPLPLGLTFTGGVDNVFDQQLNTQWPGFTGRQVYAGLLYRP
jgi:outer membrane receptor for ferrienterochelin and colicins